MLALDINLQVQGNRGSAVGLSTGAVRLGSDEIDGEGEGQVTDEVGQEEKSASGDAEEDRRRREGMEVSRNLRGDVGDTAGDLVLTPQNPLYVTLHGSRRLGLGFRKLETLPYISTCSSESIHSFPKSCFLCSQLFHTLNFK